MKTGTYKTTSGQEIEVLSFDEENKIAYVHLISGQYKWYSESEYSTWTSNDTATVETKEEPIKVEKKKKNKKDE